MPTMSSDAEFYIVMSEAVGDAISEVLDKIFDELRQTIQDEIYSANAPTSDYQRANDLADAWEVEARGLFGEITFRPDMLHADADSWNYESTYGANVTDIIFDILAGGYRAYNAKNGKFVMPRPMWDIFLRKLDSKFDKWMRSALRHQGLVVI